jgi:chemotaxis protein methyltransferase CheR
MTGVFSTASDTISNEDRQRIAVFVDKVAGIQLPPSKKVLIETRLRKRQRVLNFNSLKDYVDAVLKEGERSNELVYFLDALTTNKTGFYREEEHFQFLLEQVAQKRLFDSGIYSVWSAGCSSGEEPYTLAIELTDLADKRGTFVPRILATDISVSSLKAARRGIYSHDKIEMMSLDKRRRHLLRGKNKGDERVMIAPETQACVDFQEFNLITGDYTQHEKKFDVIFCRNVMIYFANSDRQRLTKQFAQSLKEGGLLFIGHSESLLDADSLFERLVPTIYRKR